MMAKRKRAPGGGRKRLGSSVAENLTIRIDPELRERLEAEAIQRSRRKRNWSLTQEILMRLNQSLAGERDDSRDAPNHAICFLVSQLIKQISVMCRDNWHRDPFYFQAFKLAVGQVLASIEPKGEIVSPKATIGVLQTPERFGECLSENVLLDLFMSLSSEEKAWVWENDDEDATEVMRDVYGFERARRHLGIETSKTKKGE